MLQEAYDLSTDIVAGGMGFGGGIGRCQSVCGAISGSIIALSHCATATTNAEQEARAKARELARESYKAFAAKFGHTDCRMLTGFDFQTPGGYDAFHQRDVDAGERFCNRYVEYAVRTAMGLLGGS
ncbi:MAG: C-GCAxxG-C-C family protein [Chloroflexi bacterium]|nr:C-GCAxxG-C-C family protein [Chloroflexota bacterium]